MAIAIWSSRFETGIDIIDAQHKDLFAAINSLVDSYQSGVAHEEVTRSLAFLGQYVLEHINDEERFMREMGFPGLASHAEEHARFIQRFRELEANMQAGQLVTMDVTILMADWLSNHIETADMQYVDFLKGRRGL